MHCPNQPKLNQIINKGSVFSFFLWVFLLDLFLRVGPSSAPSLSGSSCSSSPSFIMSSNKPSYSSFLAGFFKTLGSSSSSLSSFFFFVFPDLVPCVFGVWGVLRQPPPHWLGSTFHRQRSLQAHSAEATMRTGDFLGFAGLGCEKVYVKWATSPLILKDETTRLKTKWLIFSLKKGPLPPPPAVDALIAWAFGATLGAGAVSKDW